MKRRSDARLYRVIKHIGDNRGNGEIIRSKVISKQIRLEEAEKMVERCERREWNGFDEFEIRRVWK